MQERNQKNVRKKEYSIYNFSKNNNNNGTRKITNNRNNQLAHVKMVKSHK